MIRLLRDNPKTLGGRLDRRPAGRMVVRWLAVAAVLCGVVAAGLRLLPVTLPIGQSLAATGARKTHYVVAPPARDCARSHRSLQSELSDIAQRFNGKVGIAVTEVGCDWVAGERSHEFFPQQSVSKLWVALTVMTAVDDGRVDLNRDLTIRPADFVVFNQPLRAQVLEQGQVTRPIDWLLAEALSHSDNLANDQLLWTVGGPPQVRTMFQRKQIEGIRFGPGERLLQSRIAGLQWQPEYAQGRNFEQARARLPKDVREAALNRYLADPYDGAQPAAVARTLARLARGELLSPASTKVMMDILSKTHSGPRRLKAGAPAGWTVYHKTGTGQELAGRATSYNDVGILRSPDGNEYALAVMIAQTGVPIPVRMDMMQSVTRAVARFDEAKVAERDRPAGETTGKL